MLAAGAQLDLHNNGHKAPVIASGLEQGGPESPANTEKLKRGLSFHKQSLTPHTSNRNSFWRQCTRMQGVGAEAGIRIIETVAWRKPSCQGCPAHPVGVPAFQKGRLLAPSERRSSCAPAGMMAFATVDSNAGLCVRPGLYPSKHIRAQKPVAPL